MAIKVNNTTIVDDSRNLYNIASVDSITATAIGNAGVGGGAWELLNTATASGASYLSMTSGIQSGYDYYVAIVDDFRSSVTDVNGFLETTHNGTTWNTSSWYHQYEKWFSTSRSFTYGGSNGRFASALGYAPTTSPQQWAHFRIEFFNPRNTDTVKYIKVTGLSYSGFASIVVNGISSTLVSTDTSNAIQGFRLFTDSGNVSGTAKLYGLVNS